MSKINLDTLSIEQLNKLKSNIDSTIVNRRQYDLADLRQQIDAIADASEFTLQEILEAKRLRKPVKAKYRNPEDTEQTWTGRGRKPHWVQTCLSNGMELSDLLI